jgi:hypothetical protein
VVAGVVLAMLALASPVRLLADDEALAKVGPELQALYEAYRTAREQGRPSVASNPLLQIVDDRVIVDAVASGDVSDLKEKLVALGMRRAATAGRIISGELPISAIAVMSALPELRFARAAMAMTP